MEMYADPQIDRLTFEAAATITRLEATLAESESATLMAEMRADKLQAERDEALTQMTAYAREAGFAKGALDASEMAGVVEGWKARAEAAEAENARLREAVALARTCLWNAGESRAVLHALDTINAALNPSQET
jgi:hypothetical protein